MKPNELQHASGRPMRAAVAIVCDGEYLLTIKRSIHVRAPGAHCFPGGGIEHGESIEQALVREMQEELNIAVRPVRRIWESVSPRGVELNWWLAELLPDQVPVPHLAEVESFAWLTIADIRQLPTLLPSNQEFFNSWENGEFNL